MREIEKFYKDSKRRGTSYIQQNERRLIGFVTSCVGTAYKNMLLTARQNRGQKWREDMGEDKEEKRLLDILKETGG